MLRIQTVIRKSSLVAGILAGVALFAGTVSADITGFGDGSNFTLNGYDQDNSGNITNTNDPPTISAGTLTLTTGLTSEGRSAFYNIPQNITAFTASFVFQDTDQSALGAADGFAFVVQDQGLNAVGGTSSGLGYTINGSAQPPTGPAINAINNSAAEEFYLRNGTGATDFGVNGSGSFTDATSTTPVDLADGDPILITLTYSESLESLTETMLDQTTGDSYSFTRSAEIQDAVGSSTAYVGFTGATGGAYSDETISDFTYTAVPEPTSLALAAGALGLLMRRRRA